MRLPLLGTLALQAGLLLPAIPGAMAQSETNLTGGIAATLSDGTVVHAKTHASKCSVYLDAGPGAHAPAGAPGLPDGDYYFQVTDHTGRHLLSTDPVSNRRAMVSDGVIAAYTGFGGPVHSVGFDHIHPKLHGVTVQVANASCPTDLLEPPANGGTYKLWVTPVGAFHGDATLVDNACGAGCFHGFSPLQSKTDNFRVSLATPTFCLAVQASVLQPDGITIVPGVHAQIALTDSLGVSNSYFTDSAGGVQVCGLTPGTYSVSELTFGTGGTAVIGLVVNGVTLPAQPVYSFTWLAGQASPIIKFENTTLMVG